MNKQLSIIVIASFGILTLTACGGELAHFGEAQQALRPGANNMAPLASKNPANVPVNPVSFANIPRAVCGNGVVEPGEQCDTAATSCLTAGYNGGSVPCSNTCQYAAPFTGPNSPCFNIAFGKGGYHFCQYMQWTAGANSKLCRCGLVATPYDLGTLINARTGSWTGTFGPTTVCR